MTKSLYYLNYVEFFLFILFALGIAFILFALSYLLNKQTHEKELVSHYECGFIPFDNARKQFNIKFYLIAILFLIFDLEISFLFPFAISLTGLTIISLLSVSFFLLILTVGFYIEWIYKGLDWHEKEIHNK